MNDYIYIGKIANTHGIKGELRIKSDFDKKNLVFKLGNTLYIGDNYYPEVIKTYRVHKDFDMVTFNNYTNINEVLKYLKMNVYVKRSDLNLKQNEYVMSDLLGFDIIDNGQNLGKVIDYVYNRSNTLLVIKGLKQFYIPMEGNYITKIDLINHQINTVQAKDLIL